MQGKLEQYKIFKAVADSGNISATAKQLYISQSAISQSIKVLEDSLGVRLFARSKKGVALTKDGSTLRICFGSSGFDRIRGVPP